ncbi:DUF4097 family beta strand repeat-containing protein [Ancylomarina longa]|uniref:DUF4097 domain-containing protein n=1 Tax=Ancylomarina longa TaxID=2487017 RepID=A0A434AF95_9BACT|nr:DUF4097 family beta strand repeat-containing protein [Ancylomarina longa]RUT73057.1 hypothetical protein DLK05_15110 [Ancylomarina longa]
MKIQNLLKVCLLLFLLFLTRGLFAQTIYANEKASYDSVDKLEIEGAFCDVEIIGENRSDVQFEGIIQGTSGKSKGYIIHHKLNGKTLNIWIDSPNRFWGNIKGDLKFMVPQEIKIDLKNTSGDVFCSGIVAEYLKFKASSGDINIRKLKGNLDLLTTSGEVTVKELVGNAHIVSSSGDQELKFINGDIESKATSGDLKFTEIHGDVNSRTSSGDIDIEGLVGVFRNVSTSGNVNINNSKTALHLTASSGDIEGENIILVGESYFTTTSGNVYLNLNNNFEQLSFDLVASSGDLRVGNQKTEKKLYHENGDIWIHGKSSSGDQVYR